MIKTFSNKGLEVLFYSRFGEETQGKEAKRITLILDYLDAAENIQDMDLPGLDLHPLQGKRKGWLAVKISGDKYIIFRFDIEDAYDVDFLDYNQEEI